MGLKIRIETIPHNEQRYDTVGDYWGNKSRKEVRVSRLSNSTYEFLIAMHELVEAHLTEERGIRERNILKFDMNKLEQSGDKFQYDPGHDPKAPYHKEHMFAEKIEKMLAKEFGVGWKEYQAELDRLSHE
jgi:hypothetical protein